MWWISTKHEQLLLEVTLWSISSIVQSAKINSLSFAILSFVYSVSSTSIQHWYRVETSSTCHSLQCFLWLNFFTGTLFPCAFCGSGEEGKQFKLYKICQVNILLAMRIPFLSLPFSFCFCHPLPFPTNPPFYFSNYLFLSQNIELWNFCIIIILLVKLLNFFQCIWGYQYYCSLK